MTDTTTSTDASTPETARPSAAAALPVLSDAATRADLEDWGPLEEATGGEMSTSGITLWQDDDGSETGIWECTPGPSRWTLDTNEFVHVLSGSMTVSADGSRPGAEPVRLGPGDTVLFPLGWSGTWEIHETLRKLYVIF